MISCEPLQAVALALVGSSFVLPVQVEFAPARFVSVGVGGSPLVAVDPAGMVDVAAYLFGSVAVYPFGSAPGGFFVVATPSVVLQAQAATAGLNFGAGFRWSFANGFAVGVHGGVAMVSLLDGDFPLYLNVPIGFAF